MAKGKLMKIKQKPIIMHLDTIFSCNYLVENLTKNTQDAILISTKNICFNYQH